LFLRAIRGRLFGWIVTMSLKRNVLRLSAASIAPFFDFGSRFLRTIILSHLLTPSNLGAAVALATILSSCEMITDVGTNPFVILYTKTARAQAVAAARQIAIVRGLVMGAGIALFSPWLALLFGAAGHSENIAWLGVVPLIRGFRNLRQIQIIQDYRYGPDAICTVVSQIGALIAVVPAMRWFADERVLLASFVVEAVIYVSLSHLLVKREPVAKVDPAMRRAALAFGLPLMLNGVGLMILNYLDRAIVANLFDLATLAHYSLLLNLAVTPISPILFVIDRVGTPPLVHSLSDPASSRQVSLIVAVGYFVTAAAYAIIVGSFLEKLVPLIYGAQYTATPVLCALASAVAFFRIARKGPNIILVNRSQTWRLTAGNIVTGIGLLAGWLVGAWLRRAEGVLIGLLIGDVLCFCVLFGFARCYFPIARLIRYACLPTIIAGAAVLGPLLATGPGWTIRATMFAIGGLVVGLNAILIYRRLIIPASSAQPKPDPSHVFPIPGDA
jgi:O-antigen/teichoic acid export membrane protein